MLLGSTVRTYFWRLVSGAPAASVTTITKGELSTTTMASFEQTVDDLIAKPVAVFSKSYCPYCIKVKKLLDGYKIKYEAIELDQVADGTQMQNYLKSKTGQSTVPSVWIGGKHIGGCDDTHSAAKNGKLKQYLDGASISYASL